MVKPANGQVPSSELVNVQWGTFQGRAYAIALETATAAAYLKAQHAGGLSIAPPLGGNRPLVDQAGLKRDPAYYGSSLPSSRIGSPGNSTHGWGTCVDIAAGNAWFEAHCGEYGFVRESPAGENNHYRYLYPTWAAAPPVRDANTRTMKANASHIRFSYTTASDVYATLAAGSTVEALTYVTNGELVNGSRVWYGLAHGWVAGGITTEGVLLAGLTDVTIATPPTLPDPPVVDVPPAIVPDPPVVPDPPAAPSKPIAPVVDGAKITPANPTIDYQAPGPPASSSPGWLAGLIALLAKLLPGKK